MKNSYLQEVTEIIRKQQGPRGPVWMCGEQLLEMIAPGRDEAKGKRMCWSEMQGWIPNGRLRIFE